jgi:hypothetical protein
VNWHLLAFVILAIAGMGLLVFTALEIIQTSATTSWPGVTATVIESRVDRENNDGVFYRFNIAYRYEVDGRAYVGTQIRASPASTCIFESLARLKARGYSVGSSVPAYYSTSDPANAILKPGVSFGRTLGLSGFALILLANAWNQLNI